MKIEIKTVTPAIAQTWLKKTKTRNRTMSQKNIKEYTTDMLEGRWRTNGEAIKFDNKGNLLDGQHRLNAVILSRCKVDMLVVSGLDPEVFDTLDTGVVRKASVPLEIAGVSNFQRVASALAVVEAYDRGVIGRTIRVHIPTNRALEMLEKHPDIPDAIEEIGTKKCTLMTRSSFDGFFCIFRRREATMALEFMEAMRSGVGADTLDCWLSLRERLIRNQTATHRLEEANVAALLVKAWNHARRGTDTSKLLWTPSREDFPEAL